VLVRIPVIPEQEMIDTAVPTFARPVVFAELLLVALDRDPTQRGCDLDDRFADRVAGGKKNLKN
jgi:hypothetical protein